MLDELRKRDIEMRPIGVCLIGAGAMGIGIARRVNRAPGMHSAMRMGVVAAEGILSEKETH